MTTSSTCKLLLLLSIFGAVAATWSMSGYACNQPQLYSQCNCPSFCSGYMQPQYQYQPSCGYSGGCGSGGGYYPRRRHHHKKHKKPRRKFRFDSDEDEDIDIPPPPPRKKVTRVKSEEEEGFIEEKRVTQVPKTDSSWENEDLWEKKFVTERPRAKVEEKLDSEEFPEITSEEIEEAMRRKTTIPPRQVVQPAPQPAGGGLGGLGLGNGGLFGISSGVGVGVPGVGPIGISSGLGIGK